MSQTWVVVAESSRAKIFEYDKQEHSLTELKDFAHPPSRTHARYLTTDLPGRSRHGSSHHQVGQDDIKHQQSEIFARTLGNHLDSARHRHQFKKLIVMSPPAFLGKLRKKMSNETNKSVVSEIDKNLVRHNVDKIQAHIPRRI